MKIVTVVLNNQDEIRYKTFRANTDVAEHSALRSAVAEGLDVAYAYTETYIPEFHGSSERYLEI
jgi:hypothetical protein